MSWLRKPALAMLKTFNRDISIKHHWVGTGFRLNLYHHKGYWYHGRKREKECIEFFYKLVGPKDVVFEVGGHIGYLSQIFASTARRVVVFEPGQNNLTYLRQNLSPFQNVEIVEKAVSDENGTATFYLDPLTGQNNSLVKDYHVFSTNRLYADRSATTTETLVELVRLDDYVKQAGVFPTFIKIDVEGAELKVLRGMESILRNQRPRLMVEVSENLREVEQLLREHQYILLQPNQVPIKTLETLDNVFAIPSEAPIRS